MSVVALHPHTHIILPSKDLYSASATVSSVGLGQKPRAQLSGFNSRFIPQEITTTAATMWYQFFTYSVNVIQYGSAISTDLCENNIG